MFRKTDKAAGSAKSVFQLFYAGAVGTSALRGMAHLLTLQDAGCSIWPFDQLRLPAVVEIYPRIYTGPINKSSMAERQKELLSRGIDGENLTKATASDDAFDALLSVLEMEKRLDADLSEAEATTAGVARREGWIWSVPKAA